MTLSIDGTEIGQIVEVATWAATGILIAITVLVVLLLVRPPRHVRERRKAEKRGELPREMDADEAEQLWRLVDRMETRLAVLERALADRIERPAIARREEDQDLAPVEDRETGRKE